MIGVINYGLGNVQAFLNIYRRLGIPAQSVHTPETLKEAEKIILPGVGAFDWAMARLTDSGMRGALTERVLRERVPVLGVCVGMQMLAHSSDEGILEGLGWIPGKVKKLNPADTRGMLPLPHMGWNTINCRSDDPLFAGFNEDPSFYFLHSFYFEAEDRAHESSTCAYGTEFTASVRRDNVFGVQFHPEKSHDWGIQLLNNFARM